MTAGHDKFFCVFSVLGNFGRPHSTYQKVVQGKCPLHFLHSNGVVCSNTLFSNTSALTNSLFFRANSICKGSRKPRLVEHFWVPILGGVCSNKLSVGTLRPSQNWPIFLTCWADLLSQLHRKHRERSNFDGQNRQMPIASVQRTQSTLASHSADPCGTNATPTNANRVIRIAVQRTMRTKFCVFRGRYDHQRTLVIRSAAITLVSDSAIPIARRCQPREREREKQEKPRTTQNIKLRRRPDIADCRGRTVVEPALILSNAILVRGLVSPFETATAFLRFCYFPLIN